MDSVEKIAVGLVLLVVVAIAVGVGYELLHPCVKWGACWEETGFMQVGDVTVPYTYEVCDCLERE